MVASLMTLAEVAKIVPGIVLIVDAEDCVVQASSALPKLGDVLADGASVPLTDIFDDPPENLSKYLALCRGSREALPGRVSISVDGGDDVTYRVAGARIGPVDAKLVGLHLREADLDASGNRFGVLNDTIDRLKVEILRRRHVEAMLVAEKQTLASVFQGAQLNDALDVLARAVEQHSGGMYVSILLADSNNRLRHAVAPSLPDSYTQAIDGVAIGPDVGSCGTAAHTGAVVIVSDVQADPKWVDFREAAAAADLRACWSAPIVASDDAILGTLAMYYRTPRDPTESELKLIANSAYVASIAIERYRSQEMLTALLKKEQRGREEAEAQNAAKDEFLAMLGHELRNPLAAITNAALTLDAQRGENRQAGKSAESFLDIILGESRLLKRILDDLLDIARLSRGKLQLRKEAIDLDDFAAQLCKTALATYTNRQLHFEVQENLGLMYADVSRIRQSLQNLLDNAVKYSSEEDAVTLTISADAGMVTFTVTDTGDGVDEKLAETIFDPFVQLDNSIARSNSGLGLGLALVHQFAAMHGGGIALRSAGAGQGSCFTLSIPRGDVEAVAAPVKRVEEVVTAARKRVLVVEDNDSAREGLCELLTLWGHDVASAADGRKALEAFSSNPPDVALIDIGLPELDGYEVAARVRQQPGGAEIQLVALTGYGQDADRARALEAGFDSHVVKPADTQDLLNILGPPP